MAEVFDREREARIVTVNREAEYAAKDALASSITSLRVAQAQIALMRGTTSATWSPLGYAIGFITEMLEKILEHAQ